MTNPEWPGRLLPDTSTRLLDGGRAVVGGSPLRILRVTDRGAATLRSLLAGGDPTGHDALVAKLVDTGMAHPQPSQSPWSPGDVTVVIPVWDATPALARTLAALAATASVAAVLVVDDASPDADAVERVAESSPPTRVLRLPANRGPGMARNAGLAEVTTPLVAFLDAGCEPLPGWLEPLLAHLGDPLLAAVAPRIVAAAPARSAVARYQEQRSSLDLGVETAAVRARTRVSYVPAACLVARVDALRTAGGFDADLRVGEDVDLVWRLADGGARVRYEPAARVGHDHRSRFVPWFRRRVTYGTSAAPLAQRHPGALAPVGVSGWSALSWALAASEAPIAGLAVAAGTTGLLARKLHSLPHPWREALRLGGRGHLGAGRVLAAALTGPWWPLSLLAALGSRRARRAVLAAALVPPLLDWARQRPPLDPVRWVALRLADDIAYGTGVWLGCLRSGTFEPLVPDFRPWPPRP